MTRYYDNTRLSSYKECPRKYYLRHIRHWRGAGNAPPLSFGLAWHDAMDVVWSEISEGGRDKKEVLIDAMRAWEATWRGEGFPGLLDMDLEMEQRLKARTPGNAAEMLIAYIDKRWQFLSQIELIAVEKPFVVPIFPADMSILYVGRRDKDFRIDGKIMVGEHKTTSDYSVAHGIQPRYVEGWSPNSQVDGYLHSGHMDYGDDMHAVWVDAALVHKKVRHFKFIPVDRMLDHLDGWLGDTQDWISRIEYEREQFAILRENGQANNSSYLQCFPKNTDSCNGKYGPCVYRDVCKAVANPENRLEPPEGFIKEKWEPFNVLGLKAIGMQEEEEENGDT